jgi:hypothetical protein
MEKYNNGKVTPRLFDAAKVLQESGCTRQEIADHLKISKNVANMIWNAETYDDYKAAMYERSQTKRKAIEAKKKAAEKAASDVGAVPAVKLVEQEKPVQVVEHRQSVQITATHYMETKIDILIEQMKLVNAKLGAIIDDLYGTGKKGAAG